MSKNPPERKNENIISGKGHKRQRKSKRTSCPLSVSPVLKPWWCQALLPSMPRSFMVIFTKWHPFYGSIPPQDLVSCSLTNDKGYRTLSLQKCVLQWSQVKWGTTFQPGKTKQDNCRLARWFALSEKRYPKHILLPHNQRGRGAYCVKCNKGIPAN